MLICCQSAILFAADCSRALGTKRKSMLLNVMTVLRRSSRLLLYKQQSGKVTLWRASPPELCASVIDMALGIVITATKTRGTMSQVHCCCPSEMLRCTLISAAWHSHWFMGAFQQHKLLYGVRFCCHQFERSCIFQGPGSRAYLFDSFNSTFFQP